MMKQNMIRIFAAFFVLLSITCAATYIGFSQQDTDDDYEEYLVDLNEIIQLTKRTESGESQQEKQQAEHELAVRQDLMEEHIKQMSKSEEKKNIGQAILIVYVINIVFLMIIILYYYFKMIRPFERLQKFASDIAAGNLDIALPYERTNYFGAFTWAFDHMRKEIIRARACEKEAIENNKTVIATLSHDIKTPIASIRAYAEALEANLDTNQEKRHRYSEVIMKKCDEVATLTNDLFLHSISDLNKLKMQIDTYKFQDLMEEILQGISDSPDGQTGRVSINGLLPDVTIRTDKKRFEQVIENLVNNAGKYANGTVVLSASVNEGQLHVIVQDDGPGIPDEDVPFIFDKFYRGANAGERQGSGLGLYIVKYIMEQTGGSVSLQNTKEGLAVSLHIPIYQ